MNKTCILKLTCCLATVFVQSGWAQKAPDPPEEPASQRAATTPAEAVEKPAKPGLNDRFLDPDLNVDEWLGRFEVESREVFANRDQVLKACSIEKGMRVADIGAGTGLYTKIFSGAVGDSGWVYAVDISPKFLEHITERATAEKIKNVTAVLGRTDSIDLPPSSVDVVYVCDTYHHFEMPERMLASIHRALRADGVLVIVDFDRIPGKSRDWILCHVRAGKETVRDEILAAGFGLIGENKIDGFKENYMLRFRRRAEK